MATIDDRSITPEHAGPHWPLPRWSTPQKILLIAVLTCLAYLPSINGKFIFDDDIYLTANKYIEAPDGLYWFWFTNAPVDFYPVSNTSLWVEWRLWGLNPTGYHVTNLLLHIASALLVWAVLRKLLVPGAFLAALLFAIHPVNVESVAWIAQRKDLMAICFFLLSVFWYLKFDELSRDAPLADNASRTVRPTGDKWYRLSLLAFVLAMLSKASPVVLPIVLLGLAWWQRGRISRLDVRRTVPFFLIAIGLALVNLWTHSRALGETVRSGFAERLAGAGAVVWFYLSKALLPIELVVVYPQWHIQTSSLLWWLPLLAALLVTAMLLRQSYAPQANGSRPVLLAWGFYCVALLPVMGFADIGFRMHSLVTNHYQHTALIGVVALLAAAINDWHDRAPRQRRGLATASAVALVAALTILTWQQSRLYSDPIILYRATLKTNPNSWLVHNDLASELNRVGQPEEAIEQGREALRLKPDFAEAYYNIGNSQQLLGNLELAAENYRQAVTIRSDADGLTTLGVALARLGKIPEAITQFQKAIALDPNCTDAHSSLGLAYFKTDRPQEAIAEFEAALRLQRNHAGAHAGLAAVLAHEGRFKEAVDHFRQALHFSPNLTEACAQLAETYAQMQQPTEAIAAAQRAIELARLQGQASLESKISAWLDDYRAQQSQALHGHD